MACVNPFPPGTFAWTRSATRFSTGVGKRGMWRKVSKLADPITTNRLGGDDSTSVHLEHSNSMIQLYNKKDLPAVTSWGRMAVCRFLCFRSIHPSREPSFSAVRRTNVRIERNKQKHNECTEHLRTSDSSERLFAPTGRQGVPRSACESFALLYSLRSANNRPTSPPTTERPSRLVHGPFQSL